MYMVQIKIHENPVIPGDVVDEPGLPIGTRKCAFDGRKFCYDSRTDLHKSVATEERWQNRKKKKKKETERLNDKKRAEQKYLYVIQ